MALPFKLRLIKCFSALIILLTSSPFLINKNHSIESRQSATPCIMDTTWYVLPLKFQVKSAVLTTRSWGTLGELLQGPDHQCSNLIESLEWVYWFYTSKWIGCIYNRRAESSVGILVAPPFKLRLNYQLQQLHPGRSLINKKVGIDIYNPIFSCNILHNRPELMPLPFFNKIKGSRLLHGGSHPVRVHFWHCWHSPVTGTWKASRYLL